MIRNLFAITLLILSLFAKAGTGDWRIHTSYNDATHCLVVGEKVYVLASGALFSYDKEDGELYQYNTLDNLSDYDIAKIGYCKKNGALVIIYKNANIDILYPDGYVYNVIDFKNKVLASKTINDLYINETTAYISTSFGVVVFDIEKLEFPNTYNLNLNTLCSYIFDNHIFIGTNDGMYKGSLATNLLDKNNWEKISSEKILSFCSRGGELLCVIEGEGVSSYNHTKNEFTQLHNTTRAFKYLYEKDNKVYIGWKEKLAVIGDDINVKSYKTGSDTNYLFHDGDIFWSCKGTKGVVQSKIEGNSFVDGENYILPNAPVRNLCAYMKFTSDDKLLVVDGTLDYFDKISNPGTIMEYDYSGDRWTNFNADNIKSQTGYKFVNITSIDEDPLEEGHYFAGSYGQGLYEFRNGELVTVYNIESPLESPLGKDHSNAKNYIRVPRVKFDSKGNLWLTNTHGSNIVKVLKKDGTWAQLHYAEIAEFETMVDILIDSRGWLWVTSLQGGDNAGLFCAKQNNTPFDTSDDKTKLWLHNFTNQDGINYTIYTVFCINEDRNGAIWVGTDNGLFVIDNPKKFFDDGIFTQIKVPRNDGSNLADYLLNGAIVTTIATDGADRKWVGTKNNGIYLLSADGIECIHHFTTENSPLPSNGITSIAVNGRSGEVFIGTDGGIVSYTSDATRPEKKLQEGSVHAFPNPVKASYNGNISIVGLTFDCEVKIVDTAGYLIAEGISNGGQFNWNGRNAKGEKVPSGVYYVLTYDEEGNEGVATKILITR